MNSNANRPATPNEFLQNFPNLKRVKSIGKSKCYRNIIFIALYSCFKKQIIFTDRVQLDLTNIPKIFLTPNLDLSQKDNFYAVFPFVKGGLLSKEINIVMHVKQMQEKVH